jgi:hypothetical protein
VGRENATSVQEKKKLQLEKTWNEQEELNCWRVLSWTNKKKNCWQQKQETNEEDVVGLQGKSCSSKS